MHNLIFKTLLGILLILMVVLFAFSQDQLKASDDTSNAVLWEPVDIKSRDLFHGPGGAALLPELRGSTLVGRQMGGMSTKYRLRDRRGNEWVAKLGDESQPETAAVRLLWAIGYKTEINYLVPDVQLGKHGTFSNVRLEARPKDVKRGESWTWADNPFVGTREFDGLKIMMAMFNNWDLKDENNVVLVAGGRHHYVISDLGASFGSLAKEPQSKSGRSVNDPEDYARSVFVKGTRDGLVELAYNGPADHLMKGIKAEHARWLADLLLQLSDKQIMDAFRAARYSDEKASMLTAAFKARINELDRATQGQVAEQ